MGAILDHLIIEQGATLEQAKKALQSWEVRAFEYNGEQVGEIMLKENEVHVALDKEQRLKIGRKDMLKNALADLLKEKEFLVTKLFKNDRYRKQIERIGFAYTHSDVIYDYFWMNRVD
jgi:hypothetical protein